jgi:hypothetical protein
MDSLKKWFGDCRLCYFINNYIKSIQEFNGHEIYRVSQKEQLGTFNEDGTPDGFTTMVHNGEVQDGLTPIWYTTKSGVDFYVNDESRQKNGYLIEAKINYDSEGYLINFADQYGRLDYDGINNFIQLTGATDLLNGIVPFDKKNMTRVSDLYTDVRMFRYFINLLNNLGYIEDYDNGYKPKYPIYGFYLGKSDSGMTYSTADAYEYHHEYIIIQKFQQQILSIEQIKPLNSAKQTTRPMSNNTLNPTISRSEVVTVDNITGKKRSRTTGINADEIVVDLEPTNKTPRKTKRGIRKNGGSKRKTKTRRKRKTKTRRKRKTKTERKN